MADDCGWMLKMSTVDRHYFSAPKLQCPTSWMEQKCNPMNSSEGRIRVTLNTGCTTNPISMEQWKPSCLVAPPCMQLAAIDVPLKHFELNFSFNSNKGSNDFDLD